MIHTEHLPESALFDRLKGSEEESLVHCFWCERPHWGEHPLAVCPECTARLATMRLLMDSPPLDHAGNDGNGYTRFAYSYAGSAEDAYAKEWRNYDSYGGRHELDNEVQSSLAVG